MNLSGLKFRARLFQTSFSLAARQPCLNRTAYGSMSRFGLLQHNQNGQQHREREQKEKHAAVAMEISTQKRRIHVDREQGERRDPDAILDNRKRKRQKHKKNRFPGGLQIQMS